MENLKELMISMTKKAEDYGRSVDFGLRVHIIVRETEKEAKKHANKLISRLELDKGEEIRERALDAKSLGVYRQKKMRDISDNDFFVEPNLWTGIGLARSGCGAAIVGNPDQVYEKIKSYMELGIKSFILSGYPHHQEARYFAKLVLPRLKTISLPEVRNRIPTGTPKTPLGDGPRF